MDRSAKTLRVSDDRWNKDHRLKPQASLDIGFGKILRVFLPASILLFLFYLGIAWLYLPAGDLWTPDEGAKLLQTKSLRFETGRPAFDIAYIGRRLDPELVYALSNPVRDLLRVVDGRLIFERLPLFGLATLPFFNWLGMRGLYLLPALCGALAALFSALLAEKPSRWGAFALAAFGSPILIYAALFWEHTLASSLALAAALLVLHLGKHTNASRASKALKLLLAAVLLSSAFYLRQETFVFAAALLGAAWIVFQSERWWIFLSGIILAITILPFQPLHRALFAGEALPLNARFINLPLGYLRTAQWNAVPDLLVGPAEDEGPDTGWLGGLWALGAIISVAHSFSHEPSKIPHTLERIGLAVCAAAALYFLFRPLPYRSAHGLLFTTPWAVLGFIYGAKTWRTGSVKERTLALTCIIGLAIYCLVMLGLRASSPHGGLEWGARFFLTFYPVLAVLAICGLHRQPAIDRVIAVVLILAGAGFQARGLITIRVDKQIHAALNETISSVPEEHFVTDLWWLLLAAAPAHPGKALYAAADPVELGNWMALAASQGVDSFALVTLDHSLPIRLAAQAPGNRLAIREVLQVDNLLIYRLVME